MVPLKLFLFICCLISLNTQQIQNGESIEIIPSKTTNITYDFIVPEGANCEKAIILFGITVSGSRGLSLSIIEDGEVLQSYCEANRFIYYSLKSIKNQTIMIKFRESYPEEGKFTLIDITKEITVELDNFLLIISSIKNILLNFNPINSINFNIQEIKSDVKYYFFEVWLNSNFEPVGNGLLEYCYNNKCLNNEYISVKSIDFKKESKYKIRLNYMKKSNEESYRFSGFDGTSNLKLQPSKSGVYIYSINQTNLFNMYYVDKEHFSTVNIYTKYYDYIQYGLVTKDIFDKYPNSFNEINFNKYSIDGTSINITNEYDYAFIIIKENLKEDKNLLYIYNEYIQYPEPFSKYTLKKGYYYTIREFRTLENYFSSVESNKPCLRYDSFTDDKLYSRICNNKIIFAYTEDEDVEIKLRLYYINDNKKSYNKVMNIFNDEFEDNLDKYGNSDSLFFRFNSETGNYYGFFSYLIFDLKSEYYFYYNQILGNTDVYKMKFNDEEDIGKYLDIISSYKFEDKYELINDRLFIINGSQLISSFWDYGILGDIFIQKVEDNSDIILKKNDTIGNLVKLLNADKLYNLNFSSNFLIKLNKDFSDTVIEFYKDDEDKTIIGTLNSDNRVIELNIDNIKVKSNKNALIYFYAKMPNEKKLKQIIFPKEEKTNNIYFSITNLNSDNDNIYIIKDFSFENYYPMLNSSSWINITVPKTKTVNIYIENPFYKLKNFFLEEKENYIIYIANAFDENGKPYFEENKFKFGEINYINNLWNENNKNNFQLINMNKNSSFIFTKKDNSQFNYQLIYCNKNYYYFNELFEYSNTSSTNEISKNYTSFISNRRNDLINLRFYTNTDTPMKILFYYRFSKYEIINKNSLYLSDSNNIYINRININDNNKLSIKFTSRSAVYYKFYILISLVNEYNNLNTFNQGCYLTQLVTGNNNSTYILEIAYGYSLDLYGGNINELVDISNLNANFNNNTFIINVIYEDLNLRRLTFDSAETFKFEEIYIDQKYIIYSNNRFFFNYNDTNFKEFIIVINGKHKNGIIHIEGPGLYIDEYLPNSDEHNQFYFSLKNIGFYNFDFQGINIGSEFFIFPLGRQIDIIDFNEQNYFFEYDFTTKNRTLVIKYNITGLTEDKMIYFISDDLSEQIEICGQSSNQCKFTKNFYKFLKNEEYIINVYTHTQNNSKSFIINKFIFGIFKEQNIQEYQENDFGIEQRNEMQIYSLPKFEYNLYIINLNIFNYYYAENDFSNIDEIFNSLPDMNFIRISQNDKYYQFNNNSKIQKHILVVPKFNLSLKEFENCTIGFSDKLHINSGSNEVIEFGYEGKGFIIIQEKSPISQNPLKDYNFLRVLFSKGNNIRTLDAEKYPVENQKILSLNSDVKFPDFIYIDKIPESITKIELLYFEPRFTYFYALDSFNIKNKFLKNNDKNIFPYFKRINTNIKNNYDFFNYITFDLEDKVYIYSKKYYGYTTLYEINNEKYNMNDLSFLQKPIKTYENEISKFNELFALKNSQLYSGYLEYDTLYDIYMEIDNDNNIVTLPKEVNEFNNLMKLFKPDIIYNLNFEVDHLIKLDPNFDSEVIITDSKNNNIILNKTNPTTQEIKGNNVQLKTNLTSIIYFYSQLPQKISQYELIPQKGKNLLLYIELENYDICHIHYLIDFGFKGYSPFQKQSTDFIQVDMTYYYHRIYIPNYYDRLDTELVQGEKLYLYYYLDRCAGDEIGKVSIIRPSYYQSVNLNKTADFFVIDPNNEVWGKNIMFNLYAKQEISLQVHYPLNNEDTNISVNYNIFDNTKKIIYLTNSQIFGLSTIDNLSLNFNFNSNNKFVLSYSFHDKNEDKIKSYSDWINERKINNDLILNAKINSKEKAITIKFISNYIKSATKYIIIIGPKNSELTLDNFNEPCFLIDLIKNNSTKVKIYEFYDIIDEMFINKDIDVKDLISQNDDNQEYLINIISQELRFNKSLNFYNAIIVKNKSEDEININEEIIFNGKSEYKLSYSRQDNKNQLCFFLSISSSNSYELSIKKTNSEQSINYEITENSRLYSFECDYDGIYDININPSSDSLVYGIFKIFTTGVTFSLDINNFFKLYLNNKLNYQPSDLNMIINTQKLNEDKFVLFEISNLKINSKYKNETIPNDVNLFYFEKNKQYELIIEFLESRDENQEINYRFLINTLMNYKVYNLVLGESPMTFSGLNYSFIKIDYRKTPKFEIETKENPKFYFVNIISENDFNSFPKTLFKYKLEPLKNLTIIKEDNFDYAILLINFEPDKNSTSIIFKEIIDNINIKLDEYYEIIDDKTFYCFEYNSTYQSDIFMLIYNLTKEITGEILITSDSEIKSEKIIKKSYDKIYLELSGGDDEKNNYKINFKSSYYIKNYGKFMIKRITGTNYQIDMSQNIIEFEKIEAYKESSPLLINLSSLQDDYIKKFDIETGNISQFISIKKYNSTNNYFYDGDFESLISNYYYFDKNNNYYIQVKFMKANNKYILNPFKLIEFPQKNIERINESKNISYTENNTDKFVLLDYGEFSTMKIYFKNSFSEINMANISISQYEIFPKEIQNVKFEKIELNDIELKKYNNDSYIALLINLKQNVTSLEITFVKDKSSDKEDSSDSESDRDDDDGKQKEPEGLSTLNISLIAVSCVIFVVIVIVVIIIIKKRSAKNNSAKIESIKSELIDMSKSQFE